jgi:lactobin A/cerein 7B family class IIb bacteriocin
MKALTIHTVVVAVALTLLATTSMAAMEMSSLPINQLKTDTHRATAATSSVPLYALNRFDAHTVAEQEMTDQELKAVEGGASNSEIANGLYGALSNLGWNDFAEGMWKGYCGC